MKKILVSCILMICFLAVTGCGTGRGETETMQKNEAQETQNIIAAETITITPLPVTINMNQLDDCTVAVSLKEGDIYVDDTGVMQMEVTVYAYDMYDMVDIAQLDEGDTIHIRREDVQINTLERLESGLIRVNGGQDNGGFDLYTEDNGVFFEIGYSDVKSYYELGNAKLRVSETFQFYDEIDPEQEATVFYPEDFVNPNSDILYYFDPNNTSIVIENGQVTAMYRRYTP